MGERGAVAGITTVRQVGENAFDIRAARRLNRLHVELLKDNPDWGQAERRHDMNRFMARLIFCFFAEHTDIFIGNRLFTDTVAQTSAEDSSDTPAVIGTVFRAMSTNVDGGLFSGSLDVPRFGKAARSCLLHVGGLDWTKINPDIFGSMIQAIAEDEERGELGMHYTSVPNILKVLNPLFLDDLRERLGEAGDNPRTLLNLRRRISRIRVFDPACGSGNFLVIAYKELRAMEAEIDRRGEPGRRSEIALTNFRGIELRDFPAEIARLALVIAGYQCDLLHGSRKPASNELLPAGDENWITCGNALRLDWSSICPTAGGETYICGNPPYAGLSSQTPEQKADLEWLFQDRSPYWKSFDYVMGWFWKAHLFMRGEPAKAAFVATNSICQGQLVPMFWPMILGASCRIFFAYSSFKWRNLAARNAGVTVQIIGLAHDHGRTARLFETSDGGAVTEKIVANINAYIVPGPNVYVEPVSKAPAGRPVMYWGNKPTDGGHLILSADEARALLKDAPEAARLLRPYFGSSEFINGAPRFCIWVTDSEEAEARAISSLAARFERVRAFRASSKAKETRPAARYPHRFRQIQGKPGQASIIIPIHSSESRPYLPVGLLPAGSIISNAAYGLYGAPLWNLALVASRLHLVWIATVCGKIKTDFRYSNTLGWNTFPVPALTDRDKADLTQCAESILLAREHHFPATIAELYDPGSMPGDVRAAHERNDDVLERIYIGRPFRNDTERLETLFDLYAKKTAASVPGIMKAGASFTASKPCRRPSKQPT